MPRVQSTKQNTNQNKSNIKKNKKANTPLKKDQVDYKILKYAGVSLLLIVVGFVGYLVLDRYVLNPKNDTTVERFEEEDHITLNQFKWLLNQNETDPVTGVNHEVYVFIYNKDYKVCELCESLEDSIKLALQEAESKGISFYVLDYQAYPDVQAFVSNIFLPGRPALIKIEGENYASENAISTSESAILYVLNNIGK